MSLTLMMKLQHSFKWTSRITFYIMKKSAHGISKGYMKILLILECAYCTLHHISLSKLLAWLYQSKSVPWFTFQEYFLTLHLIHILRILVLINVMIILSIRDDTLRNYPWHAFIIKSLTTFIYSTSKGISNSKFILQHKSVLKLTY